MTRIIPSTLRCQNVNRKSMKYDDDDPEVAYHAERCNGLWDRAEREAELLSLPSQSEREAERSHKERLELTKLIFGWGAIAGCALLYWISTTRCETCAPCSQHNGNIALTDLEMIVTKTRSLRPEQTHVSCDGLLEVLTKY